MDLGLASMESVLADVRISGDLDRLWNRRNTGPRIRFGGCRGSTCLRNGRPVGTRTPDLYRVKVAL
jgi:hypothetical protein